MAPAVAPRWSESGADLGAWGMSHNRLAILPDVTHYEMSASPQLVQTALPFLDGKSGAGS
jgi:hypothetical protein